MKIKKAEFEGSPNIGLFGLATDKYIVIPEGLNKENELSKKVINTKAARTDLIGVFLAGNSNALLLPKIIEDLELRRLKGQAKKLNIKLKIIDSKYTALGNMILCNDKGCIASPKLKNHFEEIESALEVKVTEGKLLGVDIVGSVCIATNKGFLLNIDAEEEEFKFVKKQLKVEGDIGTVNFGSPFVKSGLIANSKGVIIGNQTTGPEIARITEALGFL